MNEYRQGQHICAIYDSADEQRAVAAAYLADGLARGERCYYVADSVAALEQFRQALKGVAVDVDKALTSTALLEATHAEAHLVDGRFDSERMLGALNEAVESALNAGFTGLRACGDMSWLVEEPPGASQIVEYEALLNPFFYGVRACGMCQYDRQRIRASLMDHALATHPSVVIDGALKPNRFYKPPSVAATRAARPSDLHWKLSELRRR